MIGESRNVLELKDYDSLLLRAALGREADALSERERGLVLLALRRSSQSEAQNGKTIAGVVSAIRGAIVSFSGIPWDEIASSSRRRELVELRAIAYHILYETSSITKYTLAATLGIEKDHATVLYALRQCGDLLTYDKVFRVKYDAIRTLFVMMLEAEEDNETPTES